LLREIFHDLEVFTVAMVRRHDFFADCTNLLQTFRSYKKPNDTRRLTPGESVPPGCPMLLHSTNYQSATASSFVSATNELSGVARRD
jgi:hypothetical protein